MAKRIILFLILILGFSQGVLQAQDCDAEKDSLRILFLGNSYTYYNNLPGIIKRVIEANCSIYVETKMFAKGGQSLANHLKNREVAKSIKNGKWDFVVLQERTGTVLSRRREFQECVRMLAEKIKKAKAKPLLYLTSTSQDRLHLQDKINTEYKRVARKYGVSVVPAGIAFKKAYEERKKLTWYHRDFIHPSPVGSYLIACVFYSSMFKRQALARPRIADPFGLSAEDDEYIRDLAAK